MDSSRNLHPKTFFGAKDSTDNVKCMNVKSNSGTPNIVNPNIGICDESDEKCCANPYNKDLKGDENCKNDVFESPELQQLKEKYDKMDDPKGPLYNGDNISTDLKNKIKNL
jgi:hypothetical protein